MEVLRVAEMLVLIFGGAVVFFALQSGRKSKSLSMILLGLGFAFVVAGTLIAGAAFELESIDLAAVELVQATSQAVGFFVIVYSLMVMKE